MPVTIRNTDILFNNGTTQSTAAVAASTDLGGVGSYALLLNASNSNPAQGATQAGSDLRISYGNNLSTMPGGGWYNPGGGNYNGGGTAASGTWRKLSQFVSFSTDTEGGRYWYTNLYVRIS